MLQLRHYQQTAIDETYKFWKDKKGVNPILVLPTGSGKSLIIAKICQDACEFDNFTRVLMLTHSAELVSQNYKELKEIWFESDAGIYSASLKKRDLKNRILFAGIQSFVNIVDTVSAFDLVIVDEAHMINNKDETRYKKVFDSLLGKNQKTKILGLSATPYRMSGGFIYGKNKMFCDVSYEVPITLLIDEGYLCPPITKGALKQYDLSDVSIKSNGEYNDIELAAVVENSELINAVVDETLEYGKNRKSWLVFANSIEHAEKLKVEFNNKNFFDLEIITGLTDKKKRFLILEDFKQNKIKCIINVNVLTVGFNSPITDMIVIARATQSTSLFVQIAGRGLRTFKDKENCLILDFGQNVLTHGTLDNIQPVIIKTGKKKPLEEPKAKECPECHSIVEKCIMTCKECGFEYPQRVINHSVKTYDGSMFEEKKEIIVNVDRVQYFYHKSVAGKDCIKVSYRYGFNFVHEFIVIDSYFGKQALQNINCFYSDINTILEHQEEYKKPTRLIIKKEGKYMNIEKRLYDGQHNCRNCCEQAVQLVKDGYKVTELFYCDKYKTVIDIKYIDVINECESFDDLPF